jgi:hypothetical protein
MTHGQERGRLAAYGEPDIPQFARIRYSRQ